MAGSRLEPIRLLVRGLYRGGYSTTTIARLLHEPSHGAVQWMIRDIARPRNDAISLSKPPKSMKPGASRQRARGIMRRKLGRPLRTTEHVHHRDHDYTNNAPENLELLPAGEHIRHHENWKWRHRWRG